MKGALQLLLYRVCKNKKKKKHTMGSAACLSMKIPVIFIYFFKLTCYSLHSHSCKARGSVFLCLLKLFGVGWSGRGGGSSKHPSCIIQATLFINGEHSQWRLKSLAQAPKLRRFNI